MSAIDVALDLVLHNEGGHKPGGDPNDPGGDTFWGISRRSYPTEPWPPSRERAMEIYRAMWMPLRCDTLPPQVAVVYLDAAVNHGGIDAAGQLHTGTPGIPSAQRLFQRALRHFDPALVEDGVIGSVTIAAAWKVDRLALVRQFCLVRALRYAEIHTFPTYAAGWLDRVLVCFQVALSMNDDPKATAPLP